MKLTYWKDSHNLTHFNEEKGVHPIQLTGTEVWMLDTPPVSVVWLLMGGIFTSQLGEQRRRPK